MKNWKVKFSNSTVSFVLDGSFTAIDKIVDKTQAIYITDENVYALHQKKFKGKKTIVIPAGEEHKQQATVDFIMEALLNFGATRQAVLIGVGGGVVTAESLSRAGRTRIDLMLFSVCMTQLLKHCEDC